MGGLTIKNGQITYSGTNNGYQYGQSSSYQLYSGMPTSIYQSNSNPLTNPLTAQYSITPSVSTQSNNNDAALLSALVTILSNSNQDTEATTTHKHKSHKTTVKTTDKTDKKTTDNTDKTDTTELEKQIADLSKQIETLQKEEEEEPVGPATKVRYDKKDFNDKFVTAVNGTEKSDKFLDINLDGEVNKKDKELAVKKGIVEKADDFKLDNSDKIRKAIVKQADNSEDGKVTEAEMTEWAEKTNNYDLTLTEKMDQKKATEVLFNLNSDDYAKFDKLDGTEDGGINTERYLSADLKYVLGEDNENIDEITDAQKYFKEHQNQLDKMERINNGGDDNKLSRSDIKQYLFDVNAYNYAKILKENWDEVNPDGHFDQNYDLVNASKSSNAEIKEAAQFFMENGNEFDALETSGNKEEHVAGDGTTHKTLRKDDLVSTGNCNHYIDFKKSVIGAE